MLERLKKHLQSQNISIQDVGRYLQVSIDRKHVRIAEWADKNQVWLLTAEGRAMIPAEVPATAAPEAPPKPKAKPHKKLVVAPPPVLDDLEE